MKFEQVCQSLNEFFMQKSIARVLLPLAVPLMFICVAFQWLGNFVSLGGVANAVSYLGFFFMMALVLSLCNFKMAAIGFIVFSLLYGFNVVKSLIKYRSMNWAGIIYLAVYLFFAYQSYKKSLQINQ